MLTYKDQNESFNSILQNTTTLNNIVSRCLFKENINSDNTDIRFIE